MADGFIVRRGGAVTEQALAPTITKVSTTNTSITFTITNNDASTAVILWEVDDATPDANSIELAAAATSSNITVTGLTEDVEYDVYATANVTGKVKSNVTTIAITAETPINYTAATGGTTLEYDSGGKRYKSHTFTSDGTFTVTTVGDAIDDRNKVDYLIIAGGGSGGGSFVSGGGGAGGYRTTLGTSGANSSAESKVVVTAQAYSIDVGSGGSSVGDATNGNSGVNSSALGITTTGGGFGASGTAATSRNGGNGGSGGGAGRPAPGGSFSGGSGTANEGFAGGDTTRGVGGAGGGGASQEGQDSLSGGTKAGDGGDGLGNLLRTGSTENRAGGGGGSSDTQEGLGGLGGGGNGGNASAGGNGTANTGSGGGGASLTSSNSGQGGSGIVVIRYEIAPSV